MRVKEGDFSGCAEGNLEIPIKLSFLLGLLVPETISESLHRHVAHVSG